ncbi:hypothetical protein PM082_007810 [Marasmius tenuissimus]|nr:hypothetical protein PM082_007810 [Marasmius tenuissimus]
MECNLTFRYKPGNLTKDVNVVFTFSAPTKSELGTDQNYVAWRVAQLKSKQGSQAGSNFNIEYTARLGFSAAQLKGNNNVVPQGTVQEMKLGQTTELGLNGSTLEWSTPKSAGGTIIRAVNKTGRFQNIAVGTVKDVGGFPVLAPTFMWKVGKNLAAEAKFQPMLKMYVNLDYRESDFMTGDIASIDPVWTGDLAKLAPGASFGFTENLDQASTNPTQDNLRRHLSPFPFVTP